MRTLNEEVEWRSLSEETEPMKVNEEFGAEYLKVGPERRDVNDDVESREINDEAEKRVLNQASNLASTLKKGVHSTIHAKTCLCRQVCAKTFHSAPANF